jgi:hypothetical protein
MRTDADAQTEDEPAGAVAERVVLSYPAALSERTRERIGQRYYRTYLARAHDSAEAGAEWEEFTDVGCCGSQIHVPFRVERVDGGSRVAADTEIEFTVREEGEIEGGWAVQNELDGRGEERA